MRIRNISCTQFAGVRDRNVSFTDGINVICGKNESGKSTLVNLLSRTLFQSAKLDRRSDKDFFELYFPGAKKGSTIVGDFADGKVTFETEAGTYTLAKEWGADARCTLSTPDGIIRDQSRIAEILKELLLFGEGVYSDILLSSQRNTDVSLQTILDAPKSEIKQSITDAVSLAFAESDGITVDAIEQAIATKIEEIAGKHWDFVREAPARKVGRWSKDLGEILKAYYQLEDAQAALEEISTLERDAERAANAYTSRDFSARQAEEEFNRFSTFASRIAVQSERRKAMERVEKELLKISEILSVWPKQSEELASAKRLQTEKANRNIVDVWNQANAILAEISDEDRKAAALPVPDTSEFAAIEKAQREITSLENKLCGMNLNAAIRMLGGNSIEITSVRTGEAVDISGDAAAITEAVRIHIPGVMQMQLSPADVDIASIEEKICALQRSLADIFAKYGVTTLEELKKYAQQIESAKAKIDNVNVRLNRILGDITLAQLEALYVQVGTVDRTKEEIDSDILALCGGVDIATFITKTETVIDGYCAEYGSINDLKADAFELEIELQKAKASAADAADIPGEYLSISDPQAHLEMLQKALELQQTLWETALTEKTTSASRLATYQDAHPEACRETVEKAQSHFDEVRSLLNHWLHIQTVFNAQKQSIHDNPMQDLADRFSHYLGIISAGRVTSEFPDADKLNMHIFSDKNLLDYGKLSEGTKQTVSLAFRLAVLDHLFPDGGGVIVFDDPFTDMDADRTKQSCELIKACAARHQIIFLTCKEDTCTALAGNRIDF